VRNKEEVFITEQGRPDFLLFTAKKTKGNSSLKKQG